MSRDGVGQCILLNRLGTIDEFDIGYTNVNYEWDTYGVRGALGDSREESSILHCPDANAFATCYNAHALSTTSTSDAVCPGLLAKSAYSNCLVTSRGGHGNCENDHIISLHNARLTAYDCYCNGTNDVTCEVPSAVPAQCNNVFKSFAECIRCCRSNSTNDACGAPWRGVVADDNARNPECLADVYIDRQQCSAQCQYTRPFDATVGTEVTGNFDSDDDVEISGSPPTNFMNVNLNIEIEVPLASGVETANDDVLVATLILSASRILAFDTNTVAVVGNVTVTNPVR